MSDYRDHIPDELLEAYLDGQLAGEELAEFERRLVTDTDARRDAGLQRDFELRLSNALQPRDVTASQIERLLPETNEPIEAPAVASRDAVSTRPQQVTRSRRTLLATLSALAAVVAWIAVVVQWDGNNATVQPFFQQRPLVTLYREAVEQGFRPYYFCEDETRFALTFRKRQDVPLVLNETPPDRHMVGLSYVGGLSRDTTAMLAYVDERPVVVFVDRKQFDNKQLAVNQPSGFEEWKVHRTELGDLVLYEVSPFETAKMSQYLSIPE